MRFARTLTATRRARVSFIATFAAVAITIAALAPFASSVADARSGVYGPGAASSEFLTLPFEATPNMSILSGWYYSGGAGFHGGIDYINGNVNSNGTWKTFAVIAAADGEACGNCSSRQGNAVWVSHKVNGQTFYTYYGHLASISSNIPLGSQSRTVHVKRGQFLGWAGTTGVASNALHLHFALYNSSSIPLDPYSIGKLRESYPKPVSDTPGMGWFRTSAAK